MPLPYSSSSAGQARESEIRSILRGVGASAVGFMVDDDEDKVICQFRLRGREVTIPISVGAYQAAWLRENPHTPRHRSSPAEYRRKARQIAESAAWAALADWVKAQAAMIACGFQTPETAFLPHIHTTEGRRLIETITNADGSVRMLPSPKE